MIEITNIYATNDDELKEMLNQIEGRIVSVEPLHDDSYRVIYEKAETQ